MSLGFDAIVVATGPHAGQRVCGLSLRERGRRVAIRAGAHRVLILDDAAPGVLESVEPANDLLIVRAADQVVHLPLVGAVRPAPGEPGGPRVAVDPETGAYAGAIWVPAPLAGEAASALAADPVAGDSALAARWLAEGRATPRPHGDIARHRATTREERRGATRMLFQLVHKPQDGPVTRWLYRPVARPLTRLLLPTPITPNQVSIAVAVIGLVGCAIVAGPTWWNAVLGSFLVLFAGYLDSCDGEIARLRHEGSKLGAWLDTVGDELTTTAYLGALGWHVHARHPEPWILYATALGLLATALTIYVIYYYLIVVAHSGNSQDYPSTGAGPLAHLAQLLRRDFINWLALVMVAADLSGVLFGGLVIGAVVTASVLVPEHLALRRRHRASALV